jgi:hypothetical protein
MGRMMRQNQQDMAVTTARARLMYAVQYKYTVRCKMRCKMRTYMELLLHHAAIGQEQAFE